MALEKLQIRWQLTLTEQLCVQPWLKCFECTKCFKCFSSHQCHQASTVMILCWRWEARASGRRSKVAHRHAVIQFIQMKSSKVWISQDFGSHSWINKWRKQELTFIEFLYNLRISYFLSFSFFTTILLDGCNYLPIPISHREGNWPKRAYDNLSQGTMISSSGARVRADFVTYAFLLWMNE